MSQHDQMLVALTKISEVASAAVSTACQGCQDGASELKDVPGCVVKALPARLQAPAAATAARINPVNDPVRWPLVAGIVGFEIAEPQRIAVMTSKYWGPRPRRLTVSFMETTADNLKNRIIQHMNAWTRTVGISFVGTTGVGDVRISRGGGGYYSYLGTDILHIPRNRQTMNLEGFTMNTPESEYLRVVRHETGHTLGFPHEHMRRDIVARIDPQKAYTWFWNTYRWDKATVDAQVLTPLNESTLMGTPVDQTSIMCYQLPASITRDGRPIIGGVDINANDYSFAGRIYPRTSSAVSAPQGQASDEDWGAHEDVDVDSREYE